MNRREQQMNTVVFKKSLKFIFCSALINIFLCVGSFITTKAESREVVDRVVAVVNDDIILMSELNEALNPFLSRFQEYQYSQEEKEQLLYKLREDVLNQLINERITDQQAKKAGIQITDKEIDASIEQMKQANRLTDENLRAALSQQGLTMEEFREKIREQILRSKLVSIEVKSKIVITKEDIKNTFEKETEQSSETKKYHLRSILMRVPDGSDAQGKKVIEAQMTAIHEKLEQGEKFEELARIYSHPSLASSGGYLGAFDLQTLAPDIREAVVILKPGEFSSVLDTDQGYQIFFVDKIDNMEGRSLDEASAEIEDRLYKEIVDEKFSSWLQELRQRSHIKIIR
jgi:peptidyl-prolyl cis-trans isomerase SurA